MAAAQLTHITFRAVAPPRRGATADSKVKFAVPGERMRQDAPLDPLLIRTLRHAGLDPDDYRPAALARRLAACERALGGVAVREHASLFSRRPRAGWAALDAVLIGVTEFFRDPVVFATLEGEVLPDLLRTRANLRIYSAGVSGGQELYSVAMLLAEGGALSRSELVGVDCRPRAILTARLGVYGESAMTGVSRARQLGFFEPMAGGWRVREELSRVVRFHTANVLSYRERVAWDLILFRNVAIYFDAAAAARAWELMAEQLAVGGYLCAGSAEKPPAYLPLRRVHRCVWRKDAT